MNQAENDLAGIRRIENVEQLDELLSRPTPEVVETMRRLQGDLIVLGAAGKIGPTLTRMARRATDEAGVSRRVIGVVRRITPEVRAKFPSEGIELLACDLLDPSAWDKLPDAPNVIYMAAMKFGSTGQEPTTWARNTYLPGMACQRYSNSRIVAFSTGNVYAMAPAGGGGSVESDPLCPVGDYAMSCLGRERIFSYFSESLGIPTVLVRLNYANELRYGILVDLAGQVLAGQPVDLTMGYFNAIWQGDSNAMVLRALEHAASPPLAVNVAGPETLHVRWVVEQFGRLMDKPVHFTGSESSDAFLSNSGLGYKLLGRPRVSEEQLMGWIADWQLRGGPTLGKPTHFQTRNGKF